MCNFLSAVVSRTGAIYCNPLMDSHEDIIEYFNLRDGGMGHIVRVEFSPEKREDLIDSTKYLLKVDEQETPEWFEEHRENVLSHLLQIIKNITITEDRKILLGGAFVIGNNVKVGKLIGCDIKYAGSSTIKYAGSSTIEDAGYSTIENAGSSTIEYAGSSTIEGQKHKNGRKVL